jgi:hypothetical protein
MRLAPLLLLLSVAVGCGSDSPGTGSTAPSAIELKLDPPKPKVDHVAELANTTEARVTSLEKRANSIEEKLTQIEKLLGQTHTDVDSIKKFLSQPPSMAAAPVKPVPAPPAEDAASEGQPAQRLPKPPVKRPPADPMATYTGLLMFTQPNGACSYCEKFNAIAAQEGFTGYRVAYVETEDDFKRAGIERTPVFLLFKDGRPVGEPIVGFDGSMAAFREIMRQLNSVVTSGRRISYERQEEPAQQGPSA